MAILTGVKKFFGIRLTSPNIETSNDRIWRIGSRIAGVLMTPEEALKLSAVWASVSIISKSIASSRWEVFQEDPDGNRDLRQNTNTFRLLNIRPNPEMTSFAWREAALIQALIWGNHISEIERDLAGRPAALWPIAPDRYRFERDADGNLVVRVFNFARGDVILPYRDVFHIHGPGVDGINGFDLVTIAARSLGHVAAAEIFGAAFYGNGTTFGGTLESDENLSEEQMNALRKQIEAQHGGPERAFKWLILGGGLKAARQSITPEEGQFIQTRQHLVEEVARWFGVPPHKIQDMRRSTFNNIEHQGLEFVRDALTPWAERGAQEANWKLLPGRFRTNMSTRVDLDWLAEGDAKSKAETDSTLVSAGIESVNEVRKRRGRNTIGPDGDKHVIQMNMTTLDKIGEEKEPPATPPRLPPPDEDGEGNDDDDRIEETARVLFTAAMLRCLKRQQGRAADAARNAASREDFERRIDAYQPQQAQYVGDQTGEAVVAMARLGVSTSGSADVFRTVLQTEMEDQKRLLMDAFDKDDMPSWCAIETRARDLAAVLAAELTR